MSHDDAYGRPSQPGPYRPVQPYSGYGHAGPPVPPQGYGPG